MDRAPLLAVVSDQYMFRHIRRSDLDPIKAIVYNSAAKEAPILPRVQ